MHAPARTRRPIVLAALAATLAWPRHSVADSVELSPSRDNTLIQTPAGNSNGAGDGIYAGRVAAFGQGTIRRAVLAFDLSSVPAGATVDSVELTLTLAQTTNPAALPATVHRLTASWGEAGSNGQGQGFAAQPGDATWAHRFFDTTPWSAAGGDFEAAASATQSVADFGPYVWSGAGLVADVQQWVDAVGSNHGWLVRGDESVQGTVKKFYSREGLTPPRLRVVFTPSSTGADPGPRLAAVSFAPPSPSPARGAVRLAYTLPRAARVTLVIHDAAGRVVRRLVDARGEAAGSHATTWDGLDAGGRKAAAGVYLARLGVDGETHARRIALIP